jgi:L-fuconolactonase
MAEPYVFRGSHYRDYDALNAWLARRPPEEVLEPDLPIVDPHHHLWDNPGRRYLLPELLADISGGHKILKTMFMECDAFHRASGPQEMRQIGEVEFVRGVAAMSASGKYGPTQVAAAMVANADLKIGARVRATLEAEIEAGAGIVRGIRNCLAWDKHDEINNYTSAKVPPDRLLDPVFREGVAQLAPLGLSFDVWMFFPQVPMLTDMARALPNTKMIINHCGGPICVGPYAGHREEYMAVWAKSMQELAACPNVNVKLGGLGMLFFGFGFQTHELPPTSAELADVWRPYIETCIKLFGVKRAMFESNFPPDKQSCSYLTMWNAFKRITAGYSADEKAALYGGTASKVYGLK